MPEQDVEKYLQRIFTSGYMLGKEHGYKQATDESYPELKNPSDEVPKAIGDAISSYLNPNNVSTTDNDPNNDFG
jgi:hypothetical protein